LVSIPILCKPFSCFTILFNGEQSLAGNKEVEEHTVVDGWLEHLKPSTYVPVDQVCLGKESSLMLLDLIRNAEAPDAAGRSVHECSGLEEEQVIIQQTCNIEKVVSGGPVINSVVKQTKVNLSSQSDKKEIESIIGNQARLPSLTIPRYLNLEPSLAIDWLEISWEELHIKERVGAGKSFASHYL
jgi:hypothetical protein